MITTLVLLYLVRRVVKKKRIIIIFDCANDKVFPSSIQCKANSELLHKSFKAKLVSHQFLIELSWMRFDFELQFSQ